MVRNGKTYVSLRLTKGFHDLAHNRRRRHRSRRLEVITFGPYCVTAVAQ